MEPDGVPPIPGGGRRADDGGTGMNTAHIGISMKLTRKRHLLKWEMH
jgi:hypothetical protein